MPSPRLYSQLQRPIADIRCKFHGFPSRAWDASDMRYVTFYERSVERRPIVFVGSDGTMHFWDIEARTRLKSEYHPTVTFSQIQS
jgi:Tfp pilus tip-associated adhesin PilY1